jgi:hypothetical protein
MENKKRRPIFIGRLKGCAVCGDLPGCLSKAYPAGGIMVGGLLCGVTLLIGGVKSAADVAASIV